MMGLFGKHSYLGTLAKHLPGRWDHIPTSHKLGHLMYQMIPSTNKSLACLSSINELWEWSYKVQLDNKTNNGNSLDSTIFSDHQWETDKCSILVQVHCSHDMAASALFPWHGKQTQGKNVSQFYQSWEHSFRLLYRQPYNCNRADTNKPLDSLPHLLKCVTSHWPHICLSSSSTDGKATWQASWCNYKLGHACQGCVPEGHKLILDHSCNTHPFQFTVLSSYHSVPIIWAIESTVKFITNE